MLASLFFFNVERFVLNSTDFFDSPAFFRRNLATFFNYLLLSTEETTEVSSTWSFIFDIGISAFTGPT